MSDLVVVEEKKIPEVFAKGGMESIVKMVREKASGEVFDISTATGRKNCASLAAKVARSKTYLDDLGKTFAADLKKQVKEIDGERKYCRDQLDELKAEVRKPLTEWEEAEKARVDAHEAELKAIISAGDMAEQGWSELSLEALQKAWKNLQGMSITEEHWEEYFHEAIAQREISLKQLHVALEKKEIQIEEQKELEQLRAEKAAREEEERKEKLRLEGEERARREAEAAQRQAEKDKAAAEARAKAAEEAAERAAAAERQKIKEEQEAAAREEARRKRDKEHKAAVHNKIKDKMVKLGVDEELAKKVIASMARRQVPNVTINY